MMKKIKLLTVVGASILVSSVFADVQTTCPAVLKVNCQNEQGKVVCTPMAAPTGWTITNYPKTAFAAGEVDVDFNNVSAATKDADPAAASPTQCLYGVNFSGSMQRRDVYADTQAPNNKWAAPMFHGTTCGLENTATYDECPMRIRS
jgi:hypothetical protein